MRAIEPATLTARVLGGESRAVARAVSLVENAGGQLRELMAALAPHTGGARVIGLTGSPGVGKSTSTSALVSALRRRGERVGVLAVDPSSPFTGGALLGDRVRMQHHAADPGVFIRSMASRGHLGGLSWATPHALRVLDAAGFETILVETVGVGQAEVDIAAHADTTVVLLAPGMGDGVQAAKAGVVEIADVFAVNKADREGAHATARELRQVVSQVPRAPGQWRPPVVSTVAAHEQGIDDLLAALDEHDTHLTISGERERRRLARAREEVEAIAMSALRERLARPLRPGAADLAELAQQVATARIDPYTAADRLLDTLG
ncbi:methylmalonyl Co-A mutase-associated GTPase MeaB [Salinactinospora qingdaonensis]|uniref:Methylmalonyl Co-A mutase-associated GTPase MeaB n=1 Tax=Salinactinospora qingdaonensis TaxID=702744 RepID=A0ABP7FPH1_9ACTN